MHQLVHNKSLLLVVKNIVILDWEILIGVIQELLNRVQALGAVVEVHLVVAVVDHITVVEVVHMAVEAVVVLLADLAARQSDVEEVKADQIILVQ